MIRTLFWISLSAICYSYFFYPVFLFGLSAIVQTCRDIAFLVGRQNRRATAPSGDMPKVALLVSAHNEQEVIEAKMRNTNSLFYQPGQLDFLLGLDATTDETKVRAERIACPFLKLIEYPTQRGKLAVLCELKKETTAEILVFSDANTMLRPDCVNQLVRHFHDPRVGAVSGEEIRVDANSGAPMASAYWRYEALLKFLESRLNCALGANGAIYAVRRDLFAPKKGWVVEDFQIPMEIRYSGYRVVYDPEALGYEEAAPSMAAEFKRKIRIGAGDFQSLFHNPQFLNPFKGLPAFAYFSHKVLRWLTPVFLLVTLCSNLLLLSRPGFAYFFAAQILFYALALAGYFLDRLGKRPRLFSIPLYFSMMNLALLLGLFRYVSGGQKATWGVTPRNLSPEVLSAERTSVAPPR
jgi:cellulose synthase/poly-beta-1,6-N-acetylglucosamine synthase-like glycosyltransferase